MSMFFLKLVSSFGVFTIALTCFFTSSGASASGYSNIYDYNSRSASYNYDAYAIPAYYNNSKDYYNNSQPVNAVTDINKAKTDYLHYYY